MNYDKHFDIISYHGWGFNPSCWHALEQELSLLATYYHHDQGYFNTPFPISKKTSGKNTIWLLHSYGAHIGLQQIKPKPTDYIIFFGAFYTFYDLNHPSHNDKKDIIKQTKHRLSHNTKATIEAFHLNCAYPSSTFQLLQTNTLNKELILNDLDALEKSIINLSYIQNLPYILLIHGHNDRIIEPFQAQLLKEKLNPFTTLQYIDDCGHVPMLTHPKQCAQIIEKWIETKQT